MPLLPALRPRASLWPLLPLLALPLACGRAEEAASEGPGPPARRPNVLLVTLDTTRADRLGCYGYELARTPTIDALAAEGVRVERAYAHVPLTLPSHATLLTGVHPSGHGLHVNFQGALPQDLPTLAERLREAEYRTGAFVSAWVLDRAYGLARGFERYDDLTGLADPDRRTERKANQVVDAALRWLDSEDPRPFFAWVHFFDPHDPYEPPNFFSNGLPSLYDGELAFVDAELARLLAVLDARGELEDLVVVLTADHGESLGEHEEATHGVFLYDATMRVPLIVRAPGLLPAGALAAGPVGLVDLAPTVLELLALPPVRTHEGESFLPLLLGRQAAPRTVWLESEYPRRAFGWARLHALVSGDEKVIRAPTPELYDLASDPDERTNLAPQQAGRVESLMQALQRRRAGALRREALELEPAARAAAQGHLTALGYVTAASGELADDDLSLRDPKDATHVLAALGRARRFADARQPERVVAALEPLADDSPESDELFALLGAAQLELSQLEAAEASLRKSLRENPDHAQRLMQLGDAVRGLDRPAEALALWTRAVEAEPGLGPAHARLGLGQAQAGRFELALHHFRRHAQLEPDSASAQVNLANVLVTRGLPEQGIEHLARALELDPLCEPAHRSLWRALLLLDRRAEAIRALREARSVSPADRSLACELAWLLATTEVSDGAPGEALALAEACVAGKESRGASDLDLLAVAAAHAGRFERAIEEGERALELAREQGPEHLAESLAARLELYRAGSAYREDSMR